MQAPSSRVAIGDSLTRLATGPLLQRRFSLLQTRVIDRRRVAAAGTWRQWQRYLTTGSLALRPSPLIVMPSRIPPRDDDPAGPILALEAFPPTGQPRHEKPQGWDFFKRLGEPRHIVAPMVDQSELAWRILSRRHGAHLVYTPMISANAFVRSIESRGTYEHNLFWIARPGQLQEEGAERGIGSSSTSGDTDRPLIVQFAGNDPDTLLKAAQVVAPHCDGVDLNLGCPQHIARRGHYGAFLQSDWQLIFKLVNTLHRELPVPVTAKMRVFESTERTIAYAQMLERAGAQMITVHGRTREMKGHNTGLADWQKIRAVKEAVHVPVFSNGNILYHQDIAEARKVTQADGIMSAEGNLYNPAIFSEAPANPTDLYPLSPAFPFPRLIELAREYLDIVEGLSTPTASSAIKAHFFRLARPALEIHRDLRPVLGTSSVVAKATTPHDRYGQFRAFIDTLSARLQADEQDERYRVDSQKTVVPEAAQGAVVCENSQTTVPHWLAQPYYRATLPPEDELAEETADRLAKRKARLSETAAVREAGPNSLKSLPSDLIEIHDKQTDDEDRTASGTPVDRSSEDHAKRLRNLLDEAQRAKASGNSLYEDSLYEDSIVAYSTALDSLPARPMLSHDDSSETSLTGVKEIESKDIGWESLEDDLQAQIKSLRAVVYANLAAAQTKLGRDKETVAACNHALEDEPHYLKALHRRAQANERIGTWSSLCSALEDYKTMTTLPHSKSLDASLQEALRRLPARIEEISASEKQEMLSKLKGIGDNVLGYFGLSTDNFQVQQGEGGGYSLNFVR